MIILGSIIGFIYFLYELESPSMGNILFRFNSDGIKELSLDSLLEMCYAPFRHSYFWTNKSFYSVNWIITSFIGGCIGYII
jgi:hypothetical protein